MFSQLPMLKIYIECLKYCIFGKNYLTLQAPNLQNLLWVKLKIDTVHIKRQCYWLSQSLWDMSIFASGDDPICWPHLSFVRSKTHSRECCCPSLESSACCHWLCCTQRCRRDHGCLWVCVGTLHGRACGSARPEWLRPPWTTASSSLLKCTGENTGKLAHRNGQVDGCIHRSYWLCWSCVGEARCLPILSVLRKT